MDDSDIDWIVEKASELLFDKVEEGPLDEEDIELAYGMYAQTRLNKISDSFSNESERQEAEEKIRTRLREISKELNEEHWPE